MAIIKLTYGGAGGKYIGQVFECLVDDEYYDLLSQFPWRLHNDHGRTELRKAYVICDVSKDKLDLLQQHPARIQKFLEGRRPKLRLHRFIWCHHNGVDEGSAQFDIDHMNGNGLDNRLLNLRRASKAQNTYNKRGQRKENHGIYKSGNGYRAEIMHEGRRYRSSLCRTEREAKIAYDRLAKKYHGVYANLHFPEGLSTQLSLETQLFCED